MSIAPYVFPEDHGAVGDGKTDDWNAIQAAIGACAPWQTVYFSSTYAISKPLVPGSTSFNAGAGAVLSGIDGCPHAFIFTNGDRYHRLPILDSFASDPLVLAAGVLLIDVHRISNSGGGVALQGGAINNTVKVQWFASCSSCLTVSNPGATAPSTGPVIQGNKVSCNFAVGCTTGLLFDGSYNCDSNAFIIGSWDSISLSGACVFKNTFTAAAKQMLSTWRLWVTEWLGGLEWSANPAPGVVNGMIAVGPMQFCRFKTANFATYAGNWDAFAIQPGGGNTFEASSATGYSGSFIANWMDGPNKRATFGNACYLNTRRCNGAFGPHSAGDLVQAYVYTPFYDGNSFSFRAEPVVNPGLELVSVVDNSATVKGEICFTWRVLNGWSGVVAFDFQFTAGVP